MKPPQEKGWQKFGESSILEDSFACFLVEKTRTKWQEWWWPRRTAHASHQSLQDGHISVMCLGWYANLELIHFVNGCKWLKFVGGYIFTLSIPGTLRPTRFLWLFQLDDEPNLYLRKWLEITIHRFQFILKKKNAWFFGSRYMYKINTKVSLVPLF